MLEKEQVEIEWVNFIKLNGITYGADYPQVGRRLTQDDLEKEYETIEFKVADNIFDPHYKTRDGDAAFLEEGTVVYKVKGYSPSFRVAVYQRGEIWLYEADNNPQAKKGYDYYDIENKVTYIGFNSEQDGKTELFSIKDKEKVEKLVAMVLQAPVVKNKSINSNSRYFISFHLKDGTAVTRCYWNEDNYLIPDLMLPEEFKKEVEETMTD